MNFADVFNVQVFFLVLREFLESAIIISVLLSFLKRAFVDSPDASEENQQIFRKLRVQVWAGALSGVLFCFIIGGLFIAVFRLLGTNLWNSTEKLWEAFFCILASLMITFMGRSMLRMNKMQEKWRVKLARLIVAQNETEQDGKSFFKVFTRKYAMALLPFVTTLREGLEAVAFLGGLGISVPASSIPLSVICAGGLGILVGVFMYRYGTGHVSVRRFVLGSTCFLYLVAAGLMSRGVWFYEMHRFIQKVGQDVSENGSGPGSYDITNTVWHVDCCNPESDGPYMIFSALLGWQNTATYGSVISYNLYWVFVMLMVLKSMIKEQRAVKAANGVENESTSLIDQATSALASRSL